MPRASVRLSAADDPRKRWSSAVAPTSARLPEPSAEPPEAAQKVGSLGSRATKAARLPFMRQFRQRGNIPAAGRARPRRRPLPRFCTTERKNTQGVHPLRGAHSGALACFSSPWCPCSARRGSLPRRRATHATGGRGRGLPALGAPSSGFVRRSILPFFLGLCPLAAGSGVLLTVFFSCFAAPVAGAFSFVSSCRFAALRDDGARPLPRGKAARQRPRAAATNQLRARFASRLPIVTRSSSPRRAAVPAGLDKRVIMIVRRRDASRLPPRAECRGSGGSLFFARSSRKKCLH